jgi:hypothetical protein
VVDKFVKLVVGYFVYGSARDTAVSIENGGYSLWDAELYEHLEEPIKYIRRIM